MRVATVPPSGHPVPGGTVLNLKTHPLSAAIDVPSANVKAMAASIREHGLIEPIVLYQGLVLDGRLRLNAVVNAKFELSDEENFRTFTGTWDQAAAFVRERYFATIDTRYPKCPAHKLDKVKADTLIRMERAAAAPPMPDPPTLPVIPPSLASLLAAYDRLEQRTLAFLADEVDTHRRGRSVKAHGRILDVVTRANDLSATVTDAPIRRFLDNPPG